ncbi:rhodanese-like domain-containing protein [Helicobacter didelphidarum]|uniref:Rhodanese-like domain-containing protein n=1 Tax=Helicobacter didelphidarum TaxID=2040648 RepID=A0A3D8ISS9_9HELI|nr:rhodanese-like domain-containing protein [Helicobacter didelphidarum]RDU67641.1 rhodanese-like domain-containing protein [Helicobacter didelphidarum]
MQEYGKNYKSLAKPVYIEEMNLNNYMVIDIRDPEEVCAARIKGVPNIKEPHAICNLAKDNPEKKVLVHCKRGGRASQMGSELVKRGCNNIYFFDDIFSRFYEKFEIVGDNKDCLKDLSY